MGEVEREGGREKGREGGGGVHACMISLSLYSTSGARACAASLLRDGMLILWAMTWIMDGAMWKLISPGPGQEKARGERAAEAQSAG